MKVSAIIVTRGDVDITPILASFPNSWERIIWNNGNGMGTWKGNGNESADRGFFETTDLAVYGRYTAIKHATNPLCYVQDDDCIVSDPERIVWESDSGGSEYGRLVCNMPPEFRPHYDGHALVGFGACFHRDLPKMAFQKVSLLPFESVNTKDIDERFLRTCDVVFTALTPFTMVDVPVENLPWATGLDRMYRQKEHLGERQQMLKLALQVRDSG